MVGSVYHHVRQTFLSDSIKAGDPHDRFSAMCAALFMCGHTACTCAHVYAVPGWCDMWLGEC
jgi:hypothetical protein